MRLPRSWGELTEAQFRAYCRVMTSDIPAHSAPTILFFTLAKCEAHTRTKVGTQPKVGTQHEDDENLVICRQRKRLYLVRASDIGIAAAGLDWLRTPPCPIPPNMAAHMRAIHGSARRPQLQDMSFGEFLAADSSYAGHLATGSAETADRLVASLWPGLKKRRRRTWHRVAALTWFAAVKESLARQYSHLFGPAPGDSDNIFRPRPDDMRRAVNAQIRALTKGDITAEERVLAAPLHRALAELDELAREYDELKRTT